MNANISLVVHFLCIVSVATLSFAATCVVMARPFLRWANGFEPGSRIVLLRLFAAWPLLGGLAIGVMVSLPSLRHVSKLPLDHCHSTGGCLGPTGVHMLTIGELGIAIVLLAVLAQVVCKAVRHWRRVRVLVERIDRASHARLAPGIQLIESSKSLAFSLGLSKSFAVLSTELVRALAPSQLTIICAHERIHLRYHDNWYKWVLQMLCGFQFPRVKNTLLSEHAVALELRADQQVAQHTQDRIAVAETIIAVQRLMKPLSASEPLCQFMGTAVERRVQSLLAQSRGCSLPKYFTVFVSLIAIILFIGGASPLHDALESLLT